MAHDPQDKADGLFSRREALWLTGAAGLVLGVPGVALADPAPFNARKIKPGDVSPNARPLRGKPVEVDVRKLAEARKKKGTFRFEKEELYYSVEISGADAARASVRAGKRRTVRGVTYVPIQAKAISHGFFAKSYPVDNSGDTFIDFNTLQPIKSDKVIKEKDETRIYKVRFEPKAFSAKVQRELKKGGKSSKRSYDRAVPSTIHDLFSWMYELRMEKLDKGDTYTYFIYDGWKLSRLGVKVIGREKAWTPLKEYSTIKVDITREVLRSRWPNGAKNRTNPDLTQREKPYYFSSVHLSDDEQRVPVRIYATSKKADADLKLEKYVPASSS